MSGDENLEKTLEGNYKPGFTNEMLWHCLAASELALRSL